MGTQEHTDYVKMVLSPALLSKHQKHMEMSAHRASCSLSIAVAFTNVEVPLGLVTLSLQRRKAISAREPGSPKMIS